MKKLFTLILTCLTIQLFALSGGPDLFGYTWKDSNEPGGPTFHWIDTISEDRNVTGLGDDNNRGPFNINISGNNPFTFYWYPIDKIWVGSNGYISFSSINLASIFPTIPDSLDNKHNYIAGLLADLTFAGSGNPGRCYLHVTTDSIVISWINVPFYTSSIPYYAGSNTFQIILDKNDRSIAINFLSCSGTTLNNDIRTGIENITGNIGLQPFYNTYPVANYTIKYYYPTNPTYFVTDGTAKWNSQYGNGGLFLSYPSSFTLTANILNTGNMNIPPVYTATGRVNNFNWQNILTTSVSFGDTLYPADDTTFTYPAVFGPASAGIYSFVTSLSGIQNDAFQSNDSVIQELVVIDTSLTSFELNYSDNVPDAGGISWTDGMGGLGVYFVPPVYPVKVTSTKYYIESNPSGAYFIAKIYDDDGPDETPGTLLDSVMFTGAIFVGGYNTVPTNNNIVITNGGVYVLWEMYGIGITLSIDLTLPISLRTFEYISGIWSEYRDSQEQDFLIGVNVQRTVIEDVSVPSIISPVNNALISSPTTVTCWIKNLGQQAETNFGVNYQLSSASAVTETYTGTPVLPGDSVQYSFTTQLQPGVDSSGNFCVWTSLSSDFDINNDTSCINIQTNTGIGNYQQQENISLYPNPFDDYTTLTFMNSKNKKYTLKLYNGQGQLVRTISDITTGKIKIEKKNLLNGLYFCLLWDNEQLITTNKLIIE